MKRFAFACVLAVGLVVSPAAAQVIINEIHAQGTTASPALQGDVLEIWNQSPNPVNLAGWTVGMWIGDGTPAAPPALTNFVIPVGTPPAAVVYGNCFYVLEEGGVAGAALSDPNIGGTVRGMRMGITTPWLATSQVGCRLMDASNTCQSYVYLRRGTSALPATAPNLPAGFPWVLGNIAASTFSNAHMQRKTNTNTNSFANWEQTLTTGAGSYGAPNNNVGTASQTSIGACNSPLFASFVASATSGNPGFGAAAFTVQFTDQSGTGAPGGITSWAWDFDGDNVIDATTQNPSFVYNVPGTYSVTLTVTDSSPTPQSLTRTGYITVGQWVFSAVTTGNGFGDLTISPIPAFTVPTATTGMLLVSTVTTGVVGTGPMFGVVPDSLSWGILLSNPLPGDLFHWVVTQGYYPTVPIVFPQGALSYLQGVTFDSVQVDYDAALHAVHKSNVSRLTF